MIPTILPALEAIGYDRTFAAVCANQWGVACLPSVASREAITVIGAGRAVSLRNGARLDLGGIAKGWAADTVTARLGRHGPVLVDAGGDIAVSGPPRRGGAWPVDIADPFDADKHLALLRLTKGGVATSGRDVRRWRRGGEWQHHLIDPRTGRPAETDVLSATVVAPSAQKAEVGAKVALILGSAAGIAWIDARAGLAALLILGDGDVVLSRDFPRFLWRK